MLVAALFEDLDPTDFEMVLMLLLGEHKEILERRKAKKGKRKARPLKDVWNDGPDEHLRSCELQVVVLDDIFVLIFFSSTPIIV